MNKVEIRDTLIEAILKSKPELKAEDIMDTDNLSDDLGLDSLDVVEIVMTVEKSLGIVIDDDLAESVNQMTVGGFYEKIYEMKL